MILEMQDIMVARLILTFVLLLSPNSPRHHARISAIKKCWRYVLCCSKDGTARCPQVHWPSPSSLEWTGPGAHNKNCTNTVLSNCWLIPLRCVDLQCLAKIIQRKILTTTTIFMGDYFADREFVCRTRHGWYLSPLQHSISPDYGAWLLCAVLFLYLQEQN